MCIGGSPPRPEPAPPAPPPVAPVEPPKPMGSANDMKGTRANMGLSQLRISNRSGGL